MNLLKIFLKKIQALNVTINFFNEVDNKNFTEEKSVTNKLNKLIKYLIN